MNTALASDIQPRFVDMDKSGLSACVEGQDPDIPLGQGTDHQDGLDGLGKRVGEWASGQAGQPR